MNKFHREWAESKPEVTERRARANCLPSCLHLHPSFVLALRLYLVCSLVPFTLLSLLGPLSGPWVWATHVCRRAGRVSVFERQRRYNHSEWNLKPKQEREGERLSPHHVKAENTEGDAVLCFSACLGFGNWLCLRCSLQVLAGGHSSVGRRWAWGWGAVCLRGFSAETGLHHHSLTLNSCLLLRAIGWLYVVFPKLHYQKFNNSQSTFVVVNVCVRD